MNPADSNDKITYSEPVAQLLTLGVASQAGDWSHYQTLGIKREHVPELLRLVSDPALNTADQESDAIWAPLHAWRLLGLLGDAEAVGPLLTLFDEYPHDDWLHEELPLVLGMLGPEILSSLAAYMIDDSHDVYSLVAVAQGIKNIAVRHPGARRDCVAVLVERLNYFLLNDATVNAFLIDFLCDLEAEEAMPAIERAYAADAVDLSIIGDVEDARGYMGLAGPDWQPGSRYPVTSFKKASAAAKASRTSQTNRVSLKKKKARTKRKKAKLSKKKNRK